MPVPPERKNKIMHGRISIDGEVLMASDASPGHFHHPQGFSVSLTVGYPADAERKFKALSEGGRVDWRSARPFSRKSSACAPTGSEFPGWSIARRRIDHCLLLAKA
jgi:PhnB protein